MKQLYTYLFMFIFGCSNLALAQDSSKLPLALQLMEEASQKWGVSSSDLKDMILSSEMYSQKSGIHYVYLQQTYKGIPIQNAIVTISILKNGKLAHAAENISKNIADRTNTSKPNISMENAVLSSVKHLGIEFKTQPEISSRNEEGESIFSWKEVSDCEITPKLMYIEHDGKLRLVWNFYLDLVKNADYWSMNMDADTGDFLSKNNLTVYCQHHEETYSHSKNCKIKTFKTIQKNQVPVEKALVNQTAARYNVYKLPTESPNHGPREIVTDDQYPTSSPFGWHDTDGAAGPEFTTTRGNNVYAYRDVDNNDESDGNDPEGGDSLEFDFPIDLTLDPQITGDASVTNLFYMVNMIHDVTALMGFDEAAGNFQSRNYTGAPGSGDYVFAQAFDGIDSNPPTLNNANFSTPSDGGNGRMQMFLWENAGGAVSVDAPEAIKGFVKEYGVGQFGGVIPNDNQTPITANIALGRDNSSTPTTCCRALVNASEVSGKIVLLDRGGCDFSQKVYRAQTAGAVAVIVCNIVGVNGGNGEELIGMSGASFADLVTIPSVFFKKSDCDRIRVSLSEGNNVTMTFQVRERQGAEFLDGSLDNGIIAHEFGHGISNRLTGGRLASGCLTNDEQMGEGWSDFFSLIMTHEPGDKGEDIRGIGTFAQNQSVDGGGIRRYPYSTDMNINPQTFDDIKGTDAPHPLGEVWNGMLWDLYWKFVELYGFDPDWTNTESGNHKAVYLVLEGMKMQACNPGFIAGRDAIINADIAIFNGDHNCMIWDVFSRRGLGFFADGGDKGNRNDGVENFESRPTCVPTLKIKKTLSKKLVQPGEEVTVVIKANNHYSEKETNVIITDELEPGLTYVDGSSPIAPQINGQVLSFNIGDLNYDTEYSLTYRVRASTINKSVTLFKDDFENDINWDLVTDKGNETWLPDYETYRSFETSMYVPNFEQESDASIISFYHIPVNGSNPALRFWHRYNTEITNDGGFVELSVNGGSFALVPKDKYIVNGPNSEIAYGTFALPSLSGFTGSSNGEWVDSYIDLSDHQGQNINLKFRFGANESIAPSTANAGWYVDDIELMDLYIYDTKTCISSTNNEICTEIQEIIVDSDGTVNTKDASFDYFNMILQPNPTSDYVVIKTDLPQAQKVEIVVHTLDGKEVANINKWMYGSQNIETLSTASWGKGIYMVTLRTAEFHTTQKLVLTY
ncbi:MAG: M36 family metallopeptidase [Saprospiraceae bacterium]